MTIVKEAISIQELKQMAQRMFDNVVKAVVDIEKEILAIDAPMHSDEEAELLKTGSKQENLWGINLYPDKSSKNDFIEFDSMINLKPGQGNRSRGVEDKKIRQKIITIVNRLIAK